MSQSLAALHSLKDHLLELEARGATHFWLSEDAKNILQSLPARLRSAAAPVTAPDSPAAAEASPLPVDDLDRRGIAKLEPAGATAAEKLEDLRRLAADWEPARKLGTLRDTMVFAVGNPQADLMFVGEAPGADEEAKREPFVGKAGQLLTRIIGAMGLAREDVYISNICKFRPAMPDQRTGNRKPTPEEMASCLPFVMAEIEIVRPRVIVAVGATAAEGLLDLQEPVGRMRGRFHSVRGLPVRVTYHPSYLLRNESLSERRKVWEDMMTAMEKLGMPISEKQRAFFTQA